jgi:hypothetical protein
LHRWSGGCGFELMASSSRSQLAASRTCLVAWLACGSVSGVVVRHCLALLSVIVTQLVTQQLGWRMWCVGMVKIFVRLRAREITELARLLPNGQREAYEYVCELSIGDEDEKVPPRGMDTDKAWAGLQHLLDKAEVPVDIVDCGKPFFDDGWGVTPPCLLTPVDVAEASPAPGRPG